MIFVKPASGPIVGWTAPESGNHAALWRKHNTLVESIYSNVTHYRHNDMATLRKQTENEIEQKARLYPTIRVIPVHTTQKW